MRRPTCPDTSSQAEGNHTESLDGAAAKGQTGEAQTGGDRGNCSILERCEECFQGERNQPGVEPMEFSEIEHVEAQAIGQPGQRRFRMVFTANGESLYLWMEKQQLQALGLAFEQILTHLQIVQIAIPLEDVVQEDASPIVPLGAAEMQVGRLQVGYDEEHRHVVLLVHDITTTGEDDEPDFAAHMDRDQTGELAMQIRRVVNSGSRARSNGHQQRL